jgi:hypothetical protein
MKLEKLSDYIPYATAVAKLTELQTKRNQLEAQANRPKAATDGRNDNLDREARRMLGEAVDESPDAAEAREELRVTNHAIELQRGVVAKMRTEASGKIANAKLPAYREIVKRTAAAVRELRQCQLDEVTFRAALIEADVAFSAIIPPAPFVPCSMPSEATELADHYLAEVKKTYAI